MKYKAKKELPMSGSYCGLDEMVWSQLNSGETVELEEVPALAEDYLGEVKNKKKTKGDKK